MHSNAVIRDMPVFNLTSSEDNCHSRGFVRINYFIFVLSNATTPHVFVAEHYILFATQLRETSCLRMGGADRLPPQQNRRLRLVSTLLPTSLLDISTSVTRHIKVLKKLIHS